MCHSPRNSTGEALRTKNLAHPEQDDRVPPGVRTPDPKAVGVSTPHLRLPQAAGEVPRGVLRGRDGRRGGHSLHDVWQATNPVNAFVFCKAGQGVLGGVPDQSSSDSIGLWRLAAVK